MVSKPLKIPLDDLQEWLERETIPLVEPIKVEGKRVLMNIKRGLNDTTNSCQKFLEDGESEMRKGDPKTYRSARTACRFARNLLVRIEKVSIPDAIQRENLQTLSDNLERTIVSIGGDRKRWFPRIEPYFIMNRRRLDTCLKRVIESSEELRAFLSQEYLKANAVEEVLFSTDNLVQLRKELARIPDQKKRLESRKSLLAKKMRKNQETTTLLQGKEEVQRLAEVNGRIEELGNKAKHVLRHLEKPLLKLQSLALDPGVVISVDEATKLDEYLSDPFKAISTEKEGCPLLESILKRIDKLMAQKKLKLKSSRLRKAHLQIASILRKNALHSLHQDCKEAFFQKEQLLASNILARSQDKLVELEKECRSLRKRVTFINSRTAILEDELARILKRIDKQKEELESVILELCGKNVEILL